MILSDTELHERCHGNRPLVSPYVPSLVQPASIDLRLGDSFRVGNHDGPGFVDMNRVPHQDDLTHLIENAGSYTIMPGEFVLGCTMEWVRVPLDLAMYLDGKSSLGRLGLVVHVTAGYFDPGFEGRGTLEMVNLSSKPIILRPGRPICQSRWMKLTSPPLNPYSGRYQGDTGVAGSRYSVQV